MINELGARKRFQSGMRASNYLTINLSPEEMDKLLVMGTLIIERDSPKHWSAYNHPWKGTKDLIAFSKGMKPLAVQVYSTQVNPINKKNQIQLLVQGDGNA